MDESQSFTAFTEGQETLGEGHFAYRTYASNEVIGGPHGYWISAIYDEKSGWDKMAEIAFYEATARMDPIEDKNPYIIRLNPEELGRDDSTRKSSLEEAAIKARDLIESGHTPSGIGDAF